MPKDLADKYGGGGTGHNQRTTGFRVWESIKYDGMSNQMDIV